MIRPIVLWGSEVLEKPSEPVSNITDAEVKLVQDMIETMYKAPGVGLAAPQVGIGKRIMVTDTTSGEKKDHLFTLFNPEIISTEGEQFEDEGCLSIPGFSSIVQRPKKVVIRGLDVKFFLEHLSFIKRDMIKRRIKKLIRQGKWE